MFKSISLLSLIDLKKYSSTKHPDIFHNNTDFIREYKNVIGKSLFHYINFLFLVTIDVWNCSVLL